MPMTEKEVTKMNSCAVVKLDANGIKITKTHHGQRRAYGDTTYEYTLRSDVNISDDDALIHFQNVDSCSLSQTDWRKENKSMEKHFRRYFKFEHLSKNVFRYVIVSPSTH